MSIEAAIICKDVAKVLDWSEYPQTITADLAKTAPDKCSRSQIEVEPSPQRSEIGNNPYRSFTGDTLIHSDAAKLLCLLTPRIDAFGMCAIGKNQALRVGPVDEIVVHYVLGGEGSLEWDDQKRQLLPGTVVFIPKAFTKRLVGEGVMHSVSDASAACVLSDGIIKYETPKLDASSMVLACAKVSESSACGLGFFDWLKEPLIEPQDANLTCAFDGILRELSRPMPGCKAIMESFMKQIFVVTVRNALAHAELNSPLSMTVLDPQLAQVINAIISKPSERHTAENMARLSGISPASLNEKFERVFGQSRAEYVQHARLSASIPMLLNTNLPVKTIAAAVGFMSRSHFSRAFSKLNGTDPTSYRLAEKTNLVQQ